MISIEVYKENPCKVFSLPYWKAKRISIPSNMRIVHNSDFNKKQSEYDLEKRFFRLIHHLSNIPEFEAAGIGLEVISFDRSAELVDMINRSYTHLEIRVSEDFVKSWTDTEVYCPELWIGAISDGNLIGSIICGFEGNDIWHVMTCIKGE